jgi:hypothetical protein
MNDDDEQPRSAETVGETRRGERGTIKTVHDIDDGLRL